MILNIDKPKYWTSHDVVAKLRGVLNVRKIGHGGTLDPLAVGVLIILTDEDTKKQSEIIKLKKKYFCKIAFGAISPTYDLEKTLSVSENTLSLDEIKKILKK